MAANPVFAPKYAQAFASVATSLALDTQAPLAQMKDFQATIESSKELREVMTDPSIAADQKLAVLDALAARLGMLREVRNFFAIIIDHQRVSNIGEIVAAYEQLAAANQGISEAEIISAHPLDADDRRELEGQVARLAGANQVRVAYRQDATLLGGAIVKIGSTVYDGSVRAQLEQMKQALVSA